MPKPDKTVFVVDAPINDPEDRTTISYEIHGSLSALRKLTIAASREVELPVLLAHLQSMWDREPRNQATDGHQCKSSDQSVQTRC